MTPLMIREAFLYAMAQMPAPPGRQLWIGGYPVMGGCDVYTPMADHAKRLGAKGHKVFTDYETLPGGYDAVFLECPKQQDETQGLLALALSHSKGFVMAAAPNNAGGSRLRKLIDTYGIPHEHTAKNRCQVIWTKAASLAEAQTLKHNLSHLALRIVTIEGKDWWTVPGIFGWDKIDPASRLLMEHLPADLQGHAADFGCGYGYLSAMLVARYPSIHTIDAFDVDARAVVCCTRNTPEKVHAVACDIRALASPRKYDTIVMNPPFHNGKEEDVELGKTFIRNAWESLKVGGRLFLVANRHLAYEKIVPALKIHYEGEGYKIMTARL